jgi:periplasmic divalent cation tolerance protein
MSQVSFPTVMGTNPQDIWVVMVAVPNQEEADKIADQAVRSHQAACATVIPLVHSTYWWEGKLVREQETMVLLKTTVERFQALQETIKKMHSYKVPEIIALPVMAGLPQYLEWVRNETH